ncbi:MAG: DoxX family protein [Snowella sp.]|nr:DoxX family protein [Snowella sp.]
MPIQNLTQFLPSFPGNLESVGLLCLRLVWGIVLLFYARPMLKNPLGWMDMGKPSGIPGLLQGMAVMTILGGGLAMILGFLTPLAGLGLAVAMAVALLLHLKEGVPLMKERPDAPGKSYEASLVYLAIALLFVFLGAGRFSLDFLLWGH